MSAVRGGEAARLGWLLAATRLYRAETEVGSRPAFVEGMRERGLAADPARLSRWESGAVLAPLSVVAVYESLAGALPGQLSGVAHALRPAARAPAPHSEAPAAYRRLDELFEDVAQGEGAGGTWLDIAHLLASNPLVYLTPAHWREICERLARGLVRGVDLEYVCRYEALRAILSSTAGQEQAIGAVRRLATRPGAQSTLSLTAVLQSSQRPLARRTVLSLLTSPAPRVRDGAGWAAAGLLAQEQLSQPEMAQVEEVVLGSLATDRPVPDHVVDLAVRLPRVRWGRVLAAAPPDARARLERARRFGETVSRETALAVVAPLVTATQDATRAAASPPRAVEPDEMLHRLVREALFHSHRPRRHQSSILLTASPYRDHLAREVARSVGSAPEPVASHLAELLCYLARETNRDEVTSLLADPRPDVGSFVWRATGHLGPRHDGWEERLRSELAAGAAPRHVQLEALYAAGMTGHPIIAELAVRRGGSWSSEASWWRDLGTALHPERSTQYCTP